MYLTGLLEATLMTGRQEITDKYINQDPTLEEMISEMLNNLEKMHPIAYENIAWYYLKSNQINKAIQYLRKAKDKLHPGFKAIKNSKYFSSLKDNPQFLKLFDV